MSDPHRHRQVPAVDAYGLLSPRHRNDGLMLPGLRHGPASKAPESLSNPSVSGRLRIYGSCHRLTEDVSDRRNVGWTTVGNSRMLPELLHITRRENAIKYCTTELHNAFYLLLPKCLNFVSWTNELTKIFVFAVIIRLA